MCSETIKDLCPVVESQEARLRGHSQCFQSSPDEEICSDRPIILQAPLPLIPQILHSQLPQGPAIVQLIVPAPLAGSKTVITAEVPKPVVPILPVANTISLTTTTTTPTPEVPALNAEVTHTESTNSTALTSVDLVSIGSSSTATSTETPEKVPSGSPPDTPNKTAETREYTIEYSPMTKSEETSSSSEADDNSVHDEFPPFVQSAPDSTQLRLMPEEPPETP